MEATSTCSGRSICCRILSSSTQSALLLRYDANSHAHAVCAALLTHPRLPALEALHAHVASCNESREDLKLHYDSFRCRRPQPQNERRRC